MHNLRMYKVTATDDILESGKHLRKKKAFFASVKDELKKAYIDYDDKIATGNLASLTPLWKTPKDKSNREKASELYWSGRSLVKKHWDKLEELNNGESIVCPICGLTIATEMDHYIPREKMPEFSVYRKNLIPLCHDCNHEKSTYWLDNSGHRYFFNAFFDLGLQDNLIECVISLSPTDKQPCIDVRINQNLDQKKEINRLAVSSIKGLHLLNKFKNEAQQCLRRRTRDIQVRYERERNSKSVKEFWDVEKVNYRDCQTTNKTDFIYNSTCEAIYNSNDIETWLNSL